MSSFCGFNGFGQFEFEQRFKIERFRDGSFGEDFEGKKLDNISACWSYCAFSYGRTLVLKGNLMATKNKFSFSFDEDIIQVSTCDRLCLILLQSGRLFKIVTREPSMVEEVRFGALSCPYRLPEKRNYMGKTKEKPVKITHVACGTNIRVAISDENVCYSIPIPIHRFRRGFKTKQLVCGFEHAMLLDEVGDLYTWGNGLRGQLGLGDLRVLTKPKLIDALSGIKLIYIAAGGWHSVALSNYGDIYVWGYNCDGQLGLPLYNTSASPSSSSIKRPVVYTFPQILEAPACCGKRYTDDNEYECTNEHERVLQDDRGVETGEVEILACCPTKVFAGARHTVIQRCCGSAFSAGWNFYGQLCNGTSEGTHDHFEKIPHELSLDNKIVCGPWCTIIRS